MVIPSCRYYFHARAFTYTQSSGVTECFRSHDYFTVDDGDAPLIGDSVRLEGVPNGKNVGNTNNLCFPVYEIQLSQGQIVTEACYRFDIMARTRADANTDNKQHSTSTAIIFSFHRFLGTRILRTLKIVICCITFLHITKSLFFQ